MGGVEAAGNLNRVPQDIRDRHAAAVASVDDCRERLPFDVLHDDKRDAILAADVVQHADVRVVETRNRAGLAIEAIAQLRIARQVIGQHFDGDAAIEPGVAGAIHLAHAAGAERRHDFVWAEFRTGVERH